MKILVANEKEMELVNKFIKCLHETCSFDDIESNDHSGSVDEMFLVSDEHKLIKENLYVGIVEVSEDVQEMTFDDDTCITGTCQKCGVVTEGTSNGDPITYEEYLRSKSPKRQEKWLCESCYLENE